MGPAVWGATECPPHLTGSLGALLILLLGPGYLHLPPFQRGRWWLGELCAQDGRSLGLAVSPRRGLCGRPCHLCVHRQPSSVPWPVRERL